MRPTTRWLVPLAVVCVAALAGSAFARLVPVGSVRYVGAQSVTLPLSAAPTPAAAPAPVKLAMLTSPEPAREVGLPAPVDPGLLEATAAGRVPRIGADGRTSLQHYAHPTAAGCDRPCIGLIVTGLGLAERITTQALSLPALVGLSFSPYADASSWQARARRQGHEVLLDLPLQPAAFPRDDSGPLAVSVSPAEHEEAIAAVLATGSGYVGLSAEAGAFSGAGASFAGVARMLRERGLGLVELGADGLRGVARAEGLPYAEALGPIDVDPAAASVERALAGAESAAWRNGRALVFATATPDGLDRLAGWLETLPGKGLLLAPPSRLLAGTSDRRAVAGE